MIHLDSVEAATDYIFEKLGPALRVATPLGLGKPNNLLNEIYSRVAVGKNRSLSIHTALSLSPPNPKSALAQKFFGPFSERHWGLDYPVLKYFKSAVADKLPGNIKVSEFYFQAGSALSSKHLQRNYQSVNYTHVAENLLHDDINLVLQLVSKRSTANGDRYSLSCNPDVTLDVADLYRVGGKPLMIVGVVHPELPYIGGEAEVAPEFFSAVLESPQISHGLFALPRMPISLEDHLIGFYSSLFVEDGGTLQIGIGSLSDAIVSELILRQNDPRFYFSLYEKSKRRFSGQLDTDHLHTGRFEKGLYGLTEMLTDGFMHLRRANILKRFVSDEVSGNKTYVHGSFFLGSKEFYSWLRDLQGEDARGLRMTRVSKVNDLYDPKETLLRQQRIKARFFNTTMQMSLLGEAASETLPNGKVISGVGGQYNFVAMANELKGARSILMLRSVRLEKNGKWVSNIVWNPGHLTIPRHSRDVVVTEYGIADLKGRSDEECIQRMLNITDSRFQSRLLRLAKNSGKIASDYAIPPEHLENTPENLLNQHSSTEFKKNFSPFPFGSDFTASEEKIVLALQSLQEDQKKSAIGLLIKALAPLPKGTSERFGSELDRMELNRPHSVKERLYRRLLLRYLNSTAN
ncbi:MAG: acetyl-CoA hydrolase [Bdellovibrionaceae bacterium]|nr:acetyl-CoA hydrolase [Pseudobdellovibrionaceae bacterium]